MIELLCGNDPSQPGKKKKLEDENEYSLRPRIQKHPVLDGNEEDYAVLDGPFMVFDVSSRRPDARVSSLRRLASILCLRLESRCLTRADGLDPLGEHQLAASTGWLPPLLLFYLPTRCAHLQPAISLHVLSTEYTIPMSDRPSRPSSTHLEPPRRSVELEDPGAQEPGIYSTPPPQSATPTKKN